MLYCCFVLLWIEGNRTVRGKGREAHSSGIVTKTEKQQPNACIVRQAPQGLGESFFPVSTWQLRFTLAKIVYAVSPGGSVIHSAHRRLQEKEGRKLRVMKIGSMPRRYSTPDRWATTLKVRIEPPASNERLGQPKLPAVPRYSGEQGQDLTLLHSSLLTPPDKLGSIYLVPFAGVDETGQRC